MENASRKGVAVHSGASRRTNPRRGSRLSRDMALAAAALALTGCAHTRYITISCLTKQQYEELKRSRPEKVKDQLTGQADKDIRIIAGNAIRLRAHDDGLLTVLGGCVQP